VSARFVPISRDSGHSERVPTTEGVSHARGRHIKDDRLADDAFVVLDDREEVADYALDWAVAHARVADAGRS
jgi:hypothetical protein